ncbi:serine/threonine-protein kinase [Actibacterium sp. 188UL27-1]|uniref:serine/threonine protein kinase n=1 Tax=Actibacterium sp. 188UL27-1 TaxID=2786961 RepID=UPI0019579C52|nr:serine/threonine-protein kinase [Actibacterium sp. 188UL27-1]MBM7068841.1 protein kinase [Actibacterium sp. 188UL27-1]
MASEERGKTRILPATNIGVEIGTKIVGGTYEIIEHIATGGMGEVYRGLNIHTQEPVAIKIVLAALAHDEKIIALFQKEATVLGRLHHDAIVRYNLFTVDPMIERACLVMEYVGGRPLADYIAEQPMEAEDVKILLRRLAPGLQKAHDLGVVHRDLSPDNVIIQDGMVSHAKIIDFGIAKSENFGGGTLLGGQFAGKYNYVSPEQLGRYRGEITAQSDIYSLGLVAAAASMGEPLDMGDNPGEAVDRRAEVPDLTWVHDDLRPVIECMLQPDPVNRPQSMLQVVEMLDQGSAGTLPGHTTQVPWLEPDRTVIAPPGSIAPGISRPPEFGFSNTPATAAPQAVTTPPISDSQSPFGVGSVASGKADPGDPGSVPSKAPASPQVAQRRRGASPFILIAAAVLALCGGGAGVYYAGLLDPMIVSSPLAPKIGSGGQTAGRQPEAQTAEADNDPPAGDPDLSDVLAAISPDDPDPDAGTDNEPVSPAIPDPDSDTAAITDSDSQPVVPQPSDPDRDPSVAIDNDPGPDPVPLAITDPDDPLAIIGNRVEWMRRYTLPSCVYASVLSATPSSFAIEGYATSDKPFWTLLADFQKAHGIEPDIGVRIVKPSQCPVIEFLKGLDPDRSKAPTLTLDKTVLKSREPIRGNVSQIGDREIWLMLVDAQGGIYDLSGLLKPQDDGSADFALSLRPNTRGADDGLVPQLIVAVATDTSIDNAKAPPGTPADVLMGLIKTELRSKGIEATAAAGYFRFTFN